MINVYSFKPATIEVDAVSGATPHNKEFIRPYTSKAAEGQNDGWKFMGWLLTGDTVTSDRQDKVNAEGLGSMILPAVHTVACDHELGGNNSVGAPQYFKIYNGDVMLTKQVQQNATSEVTGVTWTTDNRGTTPSYANLHKGLTMVAQWRWRQAFIPQVGNGASYTDSDEGGTVEITSVTDPSDENYNASYKSAGGKAYYAETDEVMTATAAAKDGYIFEGWYDKSGNLLTINTVYSYAETKESVRTCYARFSPTVTQTFIRQVYNNGTWENTEENAIGTLDRYSYTDTAGKPISSTATAGSGYQFVGWFDSAGNEVTDTMLTDGGTTLSYTTTGNATYYAHFTIKPADITVTKLPERTSLTAGGDITWTVTVKNNGVVAAHGLILTDTMAGVAVTAPDGVDPASFSVPAGGEVVFTVTYQNASAGTYVNHVEISQPKQDNTTEKIAEDDAEAVVVRDRHTTSPETPVAPGKPVLNTEDHVAYIIGYLDGTVRPGNHITRAEVASIFFRLLTDESRTEFWSRSNDYSDVSAEKWYNNPISTLSNADIISGYPDGTFRPNAPITRAEFATIAARFSEVVYNGGNSFTDVPENHWAARFISMAEHLGWITGYPDGSFRPNQAITRAESMTLINRVLERAVEEEHMLSDMLKWVDNTSGAWYYEAVQEATNSHTYARTDEQVPGLDFCYEDWQKILEAPDWAALERNWIAANSR